MGNPSSSQLICDKALGRGLERGSLPLGLAEAVPFHKGMGKLEEMGEWVGGLQSSENLEDQVVGFTRFPV